MVTRAEPARIERHQRDTWAGKRRTRHADDHDRPSLGQIEYELDGPVTIHRAAGENRYPLSAGTQLFQSRTVSIEIGERSIPTARVAKVDHEA